MDTTLVRLRLVTACVLLIVFCGSLSADSNLLSGWIDDFDGPQDAYRLIRAGKQYKVTIYMPLYANDQVSVKGDHMLRIGRSDGSFRVVKQSDNVVSIGPPKDNKHILDNLIEWASSWFGGEASSDNEQAVGLVIRGVDEEPLRLPLLPTGRSQLLAGERRFYLAWSGGHPPYQVSLISKDLGRKILERRNVNHRYMSDVPVELAEGRYRLKVGDAVGQWLEAELMVVNGSRRPRGPKELEEVNLPEEVEQTLRAAWLAGSENGEWVLEAYEQVSPLAEAYRPAMVLRDNFMKGNYPFR